MRRILLGAAALSLALIGAPDAGAHTPGPQYGDSEPARGETLHSARAVGGSRLEDSLKSGKDHGAHKGFKQGHDKNHGKGSKGFPFESEDDAPPSGRLSPQMSLGLALLIPALAGLAGGFVLRRRLSQA